MEALFLGETTRVDVVPDYISPQTQATAQNAKPDNDLPKPGILTEEEERELDELMEDD